MSYPWYMTNVLRTGMGFQMNNSNYRCYFATGSVIVLRILAAARSGGAGPPT